MRTDVAEERPAVRLGRLAGIALIAAIAINLRPAVVSIGPLLGQIQDDLGLSGAAAGALTTLPVLFFGAFGLAAPFFPRRAPRGDVLLVTSMSLLVVALLSRLVPGTAALFGGSLLAGVAISMGNIAIPPIIKRDFPTEITTVTAIYTVAVTTGAAVATSVVVPIEHATGSGWRLPLVLLAIPAAVAALVWLPRLRATTAATAPPAERMPVWRSATAWWVTGFMGLQSMVAFVGFGWMPTICHDRGLGETTAGYALGLNAIVQAIGALAFPLIARWARDQRPLVVVIGAMCVGGFAGIAWAPIGSVWVWAALLGLAQGLTFAVALSFIGLRAADAHVAGQLSGMAQGIGYLIAALGPLAVGAVHDATHDWDLPIVIMLVVSVVMVVPGVAAARDRTVG